MKPFEFFLRRTLATVLVALALLTVVVLSGCQPVPKAQKGGVMKIVGNAAPSGPASGVTSPPKNEDLPLGAMMTQPENPTGPSEQTSTYERKTETMIPTPATTVTETKFPDGRVITVQETKPAGTVVTESVKQGVAQKLSGSWKDTAREMGVKLASYRPVQYVGLFFIAAAGAMFHPVVRKVVGGGKSTQLAAGIIGLALVFGPSLVVGNEKLLLFSGIGLFAWHWFTSRSSYLEGKVDANKNGIPDDQEIQPPASP